MGGELVVYQGGGHLALINRIEQELALIENPVQAVQFIDRCEALRSCLRKLGVAREVYNNAAEACRRAMRIVGLFLSELPKRNGHRCADAGLHDATPSLRDLGVSKTQSSRWQQIARIPDEAFEAELATLRESDREITAAHFLKMAKRQRTSDTVVAEAVKSGFAFVNSIDQLVSAGEKFACIAADPPWRYANDASRNGAPYRPRNGLMALRGRRLLSVARCAQDRPDAA